MAEEDRDLLDDILMEEPGLADPKLEFDNKELQSLKEQLANLEKEKQGLLQGVKDERRKRQELKGRLDQVTQTVNGILTTRQQQAEQQLAEKLADSKGVPVEFTEEGDGFIPYDKLEIITSPYEQKIADLERRLEALTYSTDAASRAQKTINTIVGENEAFGPAYNKYQGARRWVEDKVIEFQRLNNIQGTLSSGQAMDHVFSDKDLVQAFEEKFDGLDLADVVTAEDSTYAFRRTLSNVAKAMTPSDNKPDSRFQRVLQKPSGLGKSANAKAGEIPLSERAGNMSATDIMNLSDDQIAALERALMREEKTDGISW